MPSGADVVLLGCGHAHLSALRHWRSAPPPVVVSRTAAEAYSGLVPALLRKERTSATMRLERAVAAAGGRFVEGTCTAIDLAARCLRLSDGGEVRFDILSLDLGAASACPPGAWACWPGSGLPDRVAGIELGPKGPVIVVGAGAAGTEVALALALRWKGSRPVALLAPGPPLPAAPLPIRQRAERALREAGVRLISGHATRLDGDSLLTAEGGRHRAAAVLWAAGLVAPDLPRRAGLACDADGFVTVGHGLRSMSHPFVFAAGDGVALGVPKSGAFAVLAGRVLARNLARAVAGRPPLSFRPPPQALAIVGIGHGRALAWRGGFWVAGAPAWWLKQTLDHRWFRPLA